LRLFNRLFNLLAKYFLNLHFAPEDFDLTETDIFLAALILHRKFILAKDFYPHKSNYRISVEQLIQLIEKSKRVSSHKRPEENSKFIYKLAVKKLKERFRRSVTDLSNDDNAFYKHYFSEICPDGDYSRFKDPLLNSKNKQKGEPRTISQKYLRAIFESKSFKNDFMEYLGSSDIILEYHKTIQKKLQKCLVGLENRFTFIDKMPQEEISKVVEYILKNKFFKLPWTYIEVNQGIVYFKQLIKIIEEKAKTRSKS